MEGTTSSTMSTSPQNSQSLPIHPLNPPTQPPPPTAPATLEDDLPIFQVTRVDMNFSVPADFAAGQVANNALILAVQTGRIMRVDLSGGDDIDNIDLPKRPNEIGVIKNLFFDSTASHLIICTTLGENYYLHSQSRTPKPLSKLRGVAIESVSWNPSQPTASTREILLGAADGTVYETYIESTTDFYRREEKYLKTVYKVDGPVSGIWTDVVPGQPDMRRIMLATPRRLLHFIGRLGRHGHEGSGSIYAKLFEAETPATRDVGGRPTATSAFAVTPEAGEGLVVDPGARPERIFAWSTAEGVLHGRLLSQPATPKLGSKIFSESRLLPASVVAPTKPTPGVGSRPKSSPSNSSTTAYPIALTQWHVLLLVDDRIVAVNRLDDSIVYNEVVLEPGQKPIALLADLKKNTFWLFTNKEILEIEVRSEDRDIWKVLLKAQKFEAALQYANNSAQKDAVATASGDYLMKKERYDEAAKAYGESSKPFEQVALAFIDNGERDALRKYLITKLSSMKKSATTQRILLTSWIIEVFMAKLNTIDNDIMTGGDGLQVETPDETNIQLDAVRKEFQDFVTKFKSDMDRKTVYEVISSHGREAELLFFSSAIGDQDHVLSYWVDRENWAEALKALNRQKPAPDPELIYKYSTVLMSHSASAFIDILLRQANLDPRRLIPAFLDYNRVAAGVPLGKNQAVRYLLHEINMRGSSDTAVHNTLVSVYAAHESRDETHLLAYLEAQTPGAAASSSASKVETLKQLPYDADFALRLCLQYRRVRACVVIFTVMHEFTPAVEMALAHGQLDLAIAVAERPEHSPDAQKKLWLAVARAVIAEPAAAAALLPTQRAKDKQPKGLAHKTPPQPQRSEGADASIKTALALLRRAPPGVLRIEDLLPLLPDAVRVDDLKEEICSALERYAADIASLRSDMDAAAASAVRLQREAAAAGSSSGSRWALIEPGEACGVCGMPLLERRFWVWRCGHGAHADCAAKCVRERGPRGTRTRVRELAGLLEQVGVEDKRRGAAVREMDEIVGADCVRCGEVAVRAIDEPFVSGDTGGAGGDEEEEDWSL